MKESDHQSHATKQTERLLTRRFVIAGSLFFVSGAAALVLESLWVRLFALSFGTTGLALATVLTAFMTGLALGGAFGGRIADRVSEPKRLLIIYAAMEAVIAVFAASMPALRLLAASVDGLLADLMGDSLIAISIGRFLVSLLVLIGPTTLMGATLPVLARAIQEPNSGEKRTARSAGLLYAVNTFGAVLGAASTPFLLLPHLGVRGTSWSIACADFSVGIIAVLVAQRVFARKEGQGGEAIQGRTTLTPPRKQRWVIGARLAVVGIAASGAIAMVYQQAWTRLLSLVIGSSVYAFSIILALFLSGLALGSAVYSRRTVSQPGQALNLATAHLVIALWTAGVIWLGDQLPAAFVIGLRAVDVDTSSVLALQIILTGLVVFVPTFFMGMTFPGTLRLVETGMQQLGVGQTVGWVYSANTLGSIVGSFVGGFFILPALGTQGTLIACACASLSLVLGYAVLGASTQKRRRAVPSLVGGILTAIVLYFAASPWNLAAMSSGVFRVSRTEVVAELLDELEPRGNIEERHGNHTLLAEIESAQSRLEEHDLWNDGLGVEEIPEMLFYRAGLTATVAVTETAARSFVPNHRWITYSLRVNGKADASLTVLDGVDPLSEEAISPQGDAETQVFSGILATLLHPGIPSSVLVIGWGSGMTAGAALDTGAELVRVVELEREVIAGSQPFQPYAGWPLRDRRLELIEDDGRRVLASSETRYDVIVSEPSNPWISGCSNLFTLEFFELVSARLNEGGRFLQWVQAYEISAATFSTILSALEQAFWSVIVFRPAHSPSDLLIVAGNEPVTIDWQRLEDRLELPAIARRLRPFGVAQPEDIVARIALDDEDIDRIVRGVVANSDDNLAVELAAPFDLVRFRDSSARILLHELGAGEYVSLSSVRNAPSDANSRVDAVSRLIRRERLVFEAVNTRDILELLESPTPEQREILLDGELNASHVARLAELLPSEISRARRWAILGLIAARAGEDHLAGLFLTAHLRETDERLPAVRAEMTRLLWEAGQPGRVIGLTDRSRRDR